MLGQDICHPHDITTVKYPMTNISGTDTYYYNTTFAYPGNYGYYIWADDTNSNENESAPETFVLLENWEMNDNRTCDISDLREVALQFGETY